MMYDAQGILDGFKVNIEPESDCYARQMNIKLDRLSRDNQVIMPAQSSFAISTIMVFLTIGILTEVLIGVNI